MLSSTITRIGWELPLRNHKLTSSASRRFSAKTTVWLNNSETLKKIFAFLQLRPKGWVMNSTTIGIDWELHLRRLKHINREFKNYWEKTTAWARRCELLNKIWDFRQASWASFKMSSRMFVLNMTNWERKMRNTKPLSSGWQLKDKIRWRSLLNNAKDWTQWYRRKTAK